MLTYFIRNKNNIWAFFNINYLNLSKSLLFFFTRQFLKLVIA